MLSVEWRVLVAVFISSTCFFLAVPVLVLLVSSSDASANLQGLTLAVSFVLSAFLAPVWGELAKRYGLKPMLLRSSMLAVAGYLAAGLAPTIEWVLAARVVTGFASGFVPMATAALAGIVSSDRLGTAMGSLSAMKSAGALAGPALGTAIVMAPGGDSAAAFTAAGVLSLVTVAVAMTLSIPHEQKPENRKTDKPSRQSTSGDGTDGSATSTQHRGAHNAATGQPNSDQINSDEISPAQRNSDEVGPVQRARSRYIALMYVPVAIFPTAGVLVHTAFPYHLKALVGSDVVADRYAGVVFSITAAVAMVVAPLWGKLADRGHLTAALTMTTIAPILPIALMPLWSHWWLMVLFVAAAAAGAGATALVNTDVAARLQKSELSVYFGRQYSVVQVSSGLAAYAVPVLYKEAASSPFWCAAAALAVAASVVWAGRRAAATD